MAGPKLVTTATTENPNVHDYELNDSGQPVFFTSSLLDPTSYAQEVGQRLKCRWQLIMGEWYLDQRIGTPWLQVIFQKGITLTTLKQIFRNVALGTPGVRSVDSVSATLDRVSRKATITYAITMERDIVVTSDQLDDPFVVDVPEVPNG